MRLAIIAFALGVAALQMQAALPVATDLAYSFAPIVFLLLLAWRNPSWRQHPYFRAACHFWLGGVAGFFWAACCASSLLSNSLPKLAEGQDINVIGTIANLPYTFEQGVRFQFLAEEFVAADGGPLPATQAPLWQGMRGQRLALGWYNQPGQMRAPDLHPGERWQLRLRLQRPHGNANPAGFDYEVWLLEQGVRATGYVRPADEGLGRNQLRDSYVPRFWHSVERGRDLLRQRIFAALPGKPYAGVIVALVIGDQRVVGQSDWQLFNRTGIGHLMSISGLHITMVAALFGKVCGALWRRSFFTSAQLPLLLPVQKVMALAAVVAALIYVLLAGCAVPAQRTLYMLAVVAYASWSGRLTQVSALLCWALAVVLLFDPWAVLAPGFWLSFGAVALILYASSGRSVALTAESAIESAERRPRWFARFAPALLPAWQALRAGARTQAIVMLGLLPLTMLLFGQVSLISPLANAVAIPLVSFIITPLALVGVLLPAPLITWVLSVAHGLIVGLVWFLQAISQHTWVLWQAPQPSFWQFSLALAGVIWLFAPRGWPWRYCGLLCCLPLLLQQPTHPASGQLWVTAFDVGQGTALLLETAEHRMLYDSGPQYSLQSDGGQRVILPYLQARGIHQLDEMLLSHSDLDHTGGAVSLMQQLPIRTLRAALLPDSGLWQVAQQRQITPLRCIAGQRWQWEGVQFEILHPTLASYDNAVLKPNARSCTLRLTVGKHHVLLAADLEAREEAQLLSTSRAQLPADVLLVPHHGSGTSSTWPFLFAVRPHIAIFQFGYRNRYRHPKAVVWQRYQQMGVQNLRNDEAGALSLKIGEEIEVEQYRESHARYWYGQ